MEVDEDGPFCVWLFFVLARGEESSCCGEEVELDDAGDFADCAGDGEFEGWSGGQGPGEVAVEPGEESGEEAVAARFFREVRSRGDGCWCCHVGYGMFVLVGWSVKLSRIFVYCVRYVSYSVGVREVYPSRA